MRDAFFFRFLENVCSLIPQYGKPSYTDKLTTKGHFVICILSWHGELGIKWGSLKKAEVYRTVTFPAPIFRSEWMFFVVAHRCANTGGTLYPVLGYKLFFTKRFIKITCECFALSFGTGVCNQYLFCQEVHIKFNLNIVYLYLITRVYSITYCLTTL